MGVARPRQLVEGQDQGGLFACQGFTNQLYNRSSCAERLLLHRFVIFSEAAFEIRIHPGTEFVHTLGVASHSEPRRAVGAAGPSSRMTLREAEALAAGVRVPQQSSWTRGLLGPQGPTGALPPPALNPSLPSCPGRTLPCPHEARQRLSVESLLLEQKPVWGLRPCSLHSCQGWGTEYQKSKSRLMRLWGPAASCWRGGAGWGPGRFRQRSGSVNNTLGALILWGGTGTWGP